MVDYAKGIPLALEVMGSFLSDKSKQEWESELSKLKTTPNQDIHNVLRISYDRLDDKVQDLFLDIACFFKGEAVNNVQKVLDGCGLFVDIGIRILKDKSLITVDCNQLQMHDLIQEMGWEIVREKCFQEPGKRTRLWIVEDVVDILKNNTGTKAVEGIFLDLSNIGEVELSSLTFSNMLHLRLLKIYNHKTGNCIEKCKVCLRQGLENLPNDLRYLFWEGYPLKSLPSKFCPEKLVELSMTNSQLEQLWDGVQNLGNLIKIDLSYSVHLIKIPDLSLASSLESINLEKCTSLVGLPSYFQYLNKVTYLNLRYRSSLEILSEIPRNIEYLDLCGTAVEELPPSSLYLSKLCHLDLGKHAVLKNFPGSTFMPFSGKLLDMSRTYIRAFPSSIKHLTSLIKLDLVWPLLPFESAVNLESEYHLHSPLEDTLFDPFESQYFDLDLFCPESELSSGEVEEYFKSIISGGTKIEDLSSPIENNLEFAPKNICELYRLEWFLPLHCLKLSKLPVLDSWCSLCNLDLSCCTRIQIPDCLGCLSSLQSLNLSGSSIECIPASIKQLCKLTSLDIGNCKSLKSLPDELPWFLQHLEASGCTSLEKVPSLGAALKRGWDQNKVHEIKPSEYYIFFNCPKLDQNAKNNIMDDAQLRILRIANFAEETKPAIVEPGGFHPYRVCICCPGSNIPMWFKYQTHGSSRSIDLIPEGWSITALLGFAVCAVVEFDECYTDEEYCPSSSSPCESHLFKTAININGDESHKFDYILWDQEFCSLVAKGKIRLEKSSYLFQWYHHCNEIFYDEEIAKIQFNLNPVRIEDHPIGLFNVKKYGIRPLYTQDAKNVFNLNQQVGDDDGEEEEQPHSKRLRQ